MNIITLPCLYDNFAYIIWCETTREAAIIDPVEATPLLAKIDELGLVLKTILCTHHHGDHIGGLKEIVEKNPDLKVVAHPLDKKRIPHVTDTVDDGDVIAVGQHEGKVIHTPGHTQGGVCYQFGKNIFTGDTLFGGGCGRLFEGTAAEMYASLAKISQNSAETLIYFGHEYTEANLKFGRYVEPDNGAIIRRIEGTKKALAQGLPSSPSSLGMEKETNPFLRSSEPTLLEKYTQHGERFDSLTLFTRLRKLKDTF